MNNSTFYIFDLKIRLHIYKTTTPISLNPTYVIQPFVNAKIRLDLYISLYK